MDVDSDWVTNKAKIKIKSQNNDSFNEENQGMIDLSPPEKKEVDPFSLEFLDNTLDDLPYNEKEDPADLDLNSLEISPPAFLEKEESNNGVLKKDPPKPISRPPQKRIEDIEKTLEVTPDPNFGYKPYDPNEHDPYETSKVFARQPQKEFFFGETGGESESSEEDILDSPFPAFAPEKTEPTFRDDEHLDTIGKDAQLMENNSHQINDENAFKKTIPNNESIAKSDLSEELLNKNDIQVKTPPLEKPNREIGKRENLKLEPKQNSNLKLGNLDEDGKTNKENDLSNKFEFPDIKSEEYLNIKNKAPISSLPPKPHYADNSINDLLKTKEPKKDTLISPKLPRSHYTEKANVDALELKEEKEPSPLLSLRSRPESPQNKKPVVLKGEDRKNKAIQFAPLNETELDESGFIGKPREIRKKNGKENANIELETKIGKDFSKHVHNNPPSLKSKLLQKEENKYQNSRLTKTQSLRTTNVSPKKTPTNRDIQLNRESQLSGIETKKQIKSKNFLEKSTEEALKEIAGEAFIARQIRLGEINKNPEIKEISKTQISQKKTNVIEKEVSTKFNPHNEYKEETAKGSLFLSKEKKPRENIQQRQELETPKVTWDQMERKWEKIKKESNEVSPNIEKSPQNPNKDVFNPHLEYEKARQSTGLFIKNNKDKENKK